MLAGCAAVIAAAPPHRWMEHIEYLAGCTNYRAALLQRRVAGAAGRWTLDPLARAQEQIRELAAAGVQLLDGRQVLSPADGQSGVGVGDAASRRRLVGGQSGKAAPPAPAQVAPAPQRRGR